MPPVVVGAQVATWGIYPDAAAGTARVLLVTVWKVTPVSLAVTAKAGKELKLTIPQAPLPRAEMVVSGPASSLLYRSRAAG